MSGCAASRCEFTACKGASCPAFIPDNPGYPHASVSVTTLPNLFPRYIHQFTDDELIAEMQRRLKK